jgi:uncharacterized membrane protein YfcA
MLVISLSALAARNKPADVDGRVGRLLGLGGIAGAQVGARLVEHVPTASFTRILGAVLLGLAVYLVVRR